MLKKSLFSIFQFILFLSLGIFLIWLSTRSFSGAEILRVKNLVFTADWKLIIPCMGILVLSHYIRAIRWKMMFLPLGYAPKTRNVFLAVIAGFFFNLLFPRLGEVMKCTLLSRDEKIPIDRLIGTMVAERVIDVICLLLVIVLTIITQMELVGGYAQEIWNAITEKLSLSTSKLILALFLIIFALSLAFIFFRKSSSSRLIKKIRDLLTGVMQGLLSVANIKRKNIFIFHTVLIWSLYLLSIRVGFLAMQDLVHLGWVPSLTILTFGSFAMIATQGGIGAYQLIVQKTLLLYGVNEVTSLAFGWLLWSVQTVMMFILGPVSLIILFFSNRKKRKENSGIVF
jgi:uncharacterized protein (TIRG00374 family)